MRIITPPEPIGIRDTERSLFLAGSIDNGSVPNWQEEFINLAKATLKEKANLKWVILNPRRKDWDPSWEQRMSNPKFYQQVDWELIGLDQCDDILFYFEKDSKSPITLLEFGLYAGNYRKSHVVCPDGFYRKGNVEILCHKKNIPMYENFQDFIDELNNNIE